MKRLLIRPGAIGDCILSFPALEAACTEDTEVWAPRAVLPLIQFAQRKRALADTGLDRVGVFESASLELFRSFDSIYSWYGTNRAEFRDAVKELPFTFFPALPPPPGVPHIPVPSAPKEDFVILHPFASSGGKRWPLENFSELALKLAKPVKWCAGPEEELPGAVRFENLYELGCWISRARLYIGNDSGISHLAAAVGTPVLALFLATDPLLWAPRGKHVHVLSQPSVEEVLLQARRLLVG